MDSTFERIKVWRVFERLAIALMLLIVLGEFLAMSNESVFLVFIGCMFAATLLFLFAHRQVIKLSASLDADDDSECGV